MNTSDIRRAMRFGTHDELIAMAYALAHEPLRPDICGRTFTLYVGNGFVDPARNTAAGAQDVATCVRFINHNGKRCYRVLEDEFDGYLGQMEQVLDDLVCISYIPTPAMMLRLAKSLRRRGIIGDIRCEVEYVQGYPVEFKSY